MSVMNIRPIKREEDLDWALKEIERYFDNPPRPDSPEADRFDILATLIEAYENVHYPIEAPDPVTALKAHMETTGHSQGDLADLLGSRSRASEVLARRRALTLPMIAKISGAWHLPADLLVKSYPLKAGSDRKKKSPAKRPRAA
jgi:HTH-type transcriptional regulator / antitoxin HigA